MKKANISLSKYVLILSCVLPLSLVQASTVSLSPAPDALAVNLSEIFTLELSLDLSDNETTGGGIDISWDDSIIQYNDNFSFDSGVIDTSLRDTAFDVIDFQRPGLLTIGFGNFSGISPVGLIGSIQFTAVGEGVTDVVLSNSIKWSGFHATSDGLQFYPIYTDTMVTVSAVPLPASIWLMMSGLIAISGFRVRKKVTSL